MKKSYTAPAISVHPISVCRSFADQSTANMSVNFWGDNTLDAGDAL